MVAFTAKHAEIVTSSFTVVPTTHSGTITDTGAFSETVVTAQVLINRVIDYLYSQASNSNTLDGVFSIADLSSLSDALYELKQVSTSDTSLSEDVSNYNAFRIADLIDTVRGFDTPYNQLTAVNQLAVISAFRDFIDPAVFSDLADGVLSADELSQLYIQITKLLDACLFSDTPIGSKYINVSLVDTTLNEVKITNTAELFQFLTETTSWFASLGFDGQDFLTYVLNTQTQGVTEYDNFSFNSMSENLACSTNGIYSLIGNTDNGTAIDTSIKTGLMDFGESLQKQVPNAYLGITSDGNVLLKTITTYRGVKKERWYQVSTNNDSFETSKVKLGKGIKSRYWQFDLSNINGANFKLDSIELTPLVLARRVK